MSKKELQPISSKVAELFEDGAWLTALTYSGPLENLKGDLMLSLAAAPPLEADRLHTIAWATAIVGALLAIFTLFYKTSPYYKRAP